MSGIVSLALHAVSLCLFAMRFRQLQDYSEQVLGLDLNEVSLPDATEAAIRSVEQIQVQATAASVCSIAA